MKFISPVLNQTTMKTKFLLVALCGLMFFASCAPIASFTMVSTQHVDLKANNVKLKENVRAADFTINDAVNNACNSVKDGAYLSDAKVYMYYYYLWVRYVVKGDVYGVSSK